MKRKIALICIILFIIIVIHLFLSKTRTKNIYSSLVYIESISDKETKTGSGFVYSIDFDKNYIITAYHVIANATYINVYNKNKEKEEATIEIYDEYNDIAILSIKDNLGLKSAKLGNSYKLRVNDSVDTIGTPISIDNFGTVTKGKVVSLDSIEGIFDFNVIKISAPVNYGSSGSPVINKEGEVIGMVFLKSETEDNSSYVIPINYILNSLKKG